EKIGRAKQRVTHVGDYDCVFRQESVQSLEQPLHRQRRCLPYLKPIDSAWPRNLARSPPAQSESKQTTHEILESHIFVCVITNRELLARGINRAARLEPCRINTQIDVGHESPEYND